MLKEGPFKCDLFSGCLWTEEDSFSKIPEFLNLDEDLFGSDIEDKIKRLEELYGHFGHGKDSDEVKSVHICNSLNIMSVCR